MKRVLLLHGFNAGPESWITDAEVKKSTCEYENCLIYREQEQEKALPYELARQGFDVWIGTWRGTDISGGYSKHNSLNEVNDRKKFWDFSYDTMAEQDFPALVDYVLDSTPAYNLSIIGYNEGLNTVVKAMSRDYFASKVDAVLGIQPCFVKTLSLWKDTDTVGRESYTAAMKPFYTKETAVIGNTQWTTLRTEVCEAKRLDENSSACTYIKDLELKQPVSVKQFDQILQNSYAKKFLNYSTLDDFKSYGGGGKLVDVRGGFGGTPISFIYTDSDTKCVYAD